MAVKQYDTNGSEGRDVSEQSDSSPVNESWNGHSNAHSNAHRAYGKYAEKSLSAVQNEAIRLERLLSCFIPESDISRIDRSAGIGCERLNDEAYEVLLRAVEFSECCQGLFDVTIL